MGRFSSNGHKPRTYAEACEELGGQPWRALEGTEQWFLAEEPRPPTLERVVDTAAFRIAPKKLVPRTAWLALGALGIAVGFVALLAPYAQIAQPVVAQPAPLVIVAQLPPAVAPPPVVAAAPPRLVAKPPARRPKPVHRRPRRHR